MGFDIFRTQGLGMFDEDDKKQDGLATGMAGTSRNIYAAPRYSAPAPSPAPASRETVQQLVDELFVPAPTSAPAPISARNPLLEALNSMTAESSTPFVSPRMEIVNAGLDDYQKSMGDSEIRQIQQAADLLPVPVPKDGIYARADKAMGGVLPFGVPIQREEGFPGMEDYIGGGPEAPPVFPDDPVMKSLAMGWGDVAQSAGGAAKWMGKKSLGDKWVQAGQKLIDANQLTPGTPGEYGLGLSVVRSMPFTAALVPAGLAGAAGGAAAAGAAGLGTLGTVLAGGAGATLISRPLESLAEAGGVYNEAIAKGMTEDQAAEAAKSTFLKNLPLAVTDFAEIGAAFLGAKFLPKPLQKTIQGAMESRFGRHVIDPAIKIAAPALIEGGEEVVQDVIQRSSLGDQNAWKWDEQKKQAFGAGAIMGGAMGGAGAIANIQAGRQEQPVQDQATPYTPPPLQKPVIEPVSYSGPVLGNIEPYRGTATAPETTLAAPSEPAPAATALPQAEEKGQAGVIAPVPEVSVPQTGEKAIAKTLIDEDMNTYRYETEGGYLDVIVDSNTGEALVDFVGVDAAHRRRGIATSLIDAAAKDYELYGKPESDSGLQLIKGLGATQEKPRAEWIDMQQPTWDGTAKETMESEGLDPYGAWRIPRPTKASQEPAAKEAYKAEKYEKKEPTGQTELAQQKPGENPAAKQELAGEGAKTTGAQPPVPAVAGNKVKQQAVIVRHPDGDGYAVSAGVDRWISGGGGAFGGGSIGKWNTVEGAIKGTSHLNKKDWDIVVSDELKPGAQQDSSRDTADSIRKAYDAVTKMYMDKYGLSEAPEQPILAAEVADEWGKRQGMKPTQARKSFREAVAKLMEEGTAGDIVIGSVRDVNNSLGRITVGGRDIQLGTVYVRTQKAETGEKTEKPAPEKKKGPTPDRVRNVFRGKKGAVRVVFPDVIHAELFAFPSKLKKAAQEGGNIDHEVKRLKHWLRLGEGDNLAAVAQDYHDSVMGAVKGLPEKETYKAPKHGEKKEVSGQKEAANIEQLRSYAKEAVKTGEIKSVTLIGSAATKGKIPNDIDLLYYLGDRDLPNDSESAEQEVEEIIEGMKAPIDIDRYDTFVQVGDRFFHLSSGAGRMIIENTDYAREQLGKPTVVLAEAQETKEQAKPPEAEVSDVPAAKYVYDSKGRKWEVLDDTSDRSKIKVRSATGAETWLGRKAVTEKAPESEAKAATESREQPLTPESIAKAYIADKASPEDGSWEKSADGNYAERFIKPLAKRLSAKGWSTVKELKTEHSNIKWMQDKGFVDTAWDKKGTPYYALKGTALPEWLTKSDKESDMAKLPDKGGAAQKKETPTKKSTASIITGKTTTAKTERGTSIEVQYAVVSADDLIASHNTDLTKNEAYPEEIQPRQRERAASEEQINRIAANLEPEFLGESPKASEGAPIVGPDLVVESGNGRVIALKRVFKNKKESAGKYKGWLAENAEKFGIDKEALEKVENPVLVRIRQTEVDRVKFAQEANEQSVASMSATEQAKADATKLDSGILSLFVPSETGEIHRLANADFIRAFMDKVVGPAEKGRYVTGDGVLSQEGVTRIKNAIFAKAYGDVTAIATLAESTDNNVKNITNAMLIAAPKLAKVKEGIESGNLHDLDISSDIAAAMKKLSHLRDVGDTVENYLNQVTMFEQELSDIARYLLDVFNKNKRHTKRIAGMLNNYADGVRGIGDPKQVTMFSRPNPTKAEILHGAIRKVEQAYGGQVDDQTSLFQDQAVRSEDDGTSDRGTPEKREGKPAEEVAKEKPTEKPKSLTTKPIDRGIALTLRKQAKVMQKAIDAKRNPAIGNQNPTARRARIAAGMAKEADGLENIQTRLISIADAIEAGTLPESLAGIRTKGQVEILLRSSKPVTPFVNARLVKDLIKDTEGVKGISKERKILNDAVSRVPAEQAGTTLYGNKLDALDAVLSAALKSGKIAKSQADWITNWTRDYKQMLRAGIETEDQFMQAKGDLEKLGEKKVQVPDKERRIKELERELIGTKIPGYFPTPKTVVEKMLEKADIKPGMKVLEPSAGKGNIADLVREKEPESDLSVIEVNSTLRDILEAKEYSLVDNDFLEHEGEYDRIVMNPPFEKGQDVDHVKHAYELLKPGGRLVSIMSESPFFRGDKKYVAFREWLEEVDGASEKLPEKSFTGKEADRQTGVAARMVVIEKPGETTGIDALREKADAALANNRPGGRGEPSSGIKSMLVHSPQKTSIKQVAAGLRIGSTKGIFKEGMTIVDMGGGLWEEGTKYLAEKGITNLVYDPYARTKEHNDKVIETLEKNGGADAAALNNVLNVIPTTEERADVLKYLYQLMKSGGQAVITVYEGNKSGKGAKRVFGDGTSTWQENRRLATYEEEIRKALPGAELQKRFGAFILTKPAVEKKPWKAVRSRVGKVVGSDTYIHKSALDTLTEHQQSQVKNAQKHIPADFGGYEIIKVAKDGSVSFIKSPDWDTAPEPRVGDSIKIAPDKALSITKGRNKNWQIYHHKWMFVKDDYAGFDVEESKARSEQWKNSGIPEAQNLTRIGNNDFWQQNVASKLGGKTTKRSAGSHAREKVQGMANPVQPPTPKSGAPAKNTIRRRDIIRFLNAKLAPIRTGRFRNKALGIFKFKPEVIRTRLANDLPTISHEIGHYLDKRLELSQNHAYDQEFITLGQSQSKKSYTKEQIREEGVAEFIRLYLTDPQQAEQEAPNYFAAFEDVLDIHEDIKDILLTAQRDIELWYSQPAEARVAGAISVDENNARKMSLDRLYSLTVDELDPLKRFTAQLGGKDVAIDKNPFLRAWLARGWNGKAETLLHYGVMDKNGKKIGKSLDEVLAPIKDDLDGFRNYAVAKHSLEVTAQGKHTGILDADAEEVVKNAPQEYQDVLEDLVEYQDALLGLLVESGVMKAESVTTMREMYPNYVPFYRVFDEDVNTVAAYMSKGGFANLRNPVKAMKGSTRDIVDPLESIIKNTYQFVNIAERNSVGRAIVELAEANEGMGRFVEKVDATHNVAKENILTVYRDGKAEKYQLDPDLYRATLALDREASNILIKILSYPASWLRAGATLSPDFMIRNPIRDQFSAFVNSKYGYIPGVDLVKGIFHAIKKDELYWQYQNSGAAHSSLVAIDRDYLQKDIKKFFKEKTTKEKIAMVVNPGTYIEMLRALSELGEYGTRLGEFAKGVKKGASFEEAALSARDLTLDFARVGSHMKHANRVIAFMNATIQGSDKIVRQFRANPKGSIIKTMASITLPSIILFLLNHDDDRYKELPQWQKDMFWIVLAKDHIFRIPKPFELGIIFGTIPERILGWALDKDPKAFRELGKTLTDAIAPGYIPTALLPIIEVWANKSFFTSLPIVPEREKSLEPKYQYGPYTTETAKAIGNLLNWSPRKIESFLRGYTGGLGLYTIKLIEGTGEVTGLMSNKNKPALAIADYPVIKSFMVKQYASPQSVEDFYDELNDLESKWSSSKQTKQLLITQEEYDRLKLMRKVADKLSEIRKVEREIQNSKNLTPAQKRRALENADKLTANFARAALGKGAVK